LSTQKRHVGLVFQDAQLFPHKTVKQNLLFGLKLGAQINVLI
jgi:molybdate transport system ATP-binding protein